MFSATERLDIEEIQDEYERETGERPSFDVASVYYDRKLEADSYRDDYTVEDFKADAAAYAEEAKARAEEEAACKAGLCGHYTCTEGQDLAEWEAFENNTFSYNPAPIDLKISHVSRSIDSV